ncbi:Uncharacterized protein APZ42_030290 [Daphnia magna]|uniref:Uncharacterized protein n=1 Tax=Daphnia magna TaxID=35525 RepID=A0A0P4XMT0_9CRUS|nr:Uncharacterized protein APZ42_030290 [Daphnia magna]
MLVGGGREKRQSTMSTMPRLRELLFLFREFTFDSVLLFRLCCAVFLLSNSRSVASALEDCLFILGCARQSMDLRF